VRERKRRFSYFCASSKILKALDVWIILFKQTYIAALCVLKTTSIVSRGPNILHESFGLLLEGECQLFNNDILVGVKNSAIDNKRTVPEKLVFCFLLNSRNKGLVFIIFHVITSYDLLYASKIYSDNKNTI